VAPNGIPVGATAAPGDTPNDIPGDMPSGEVASIPGVGLVVMPTCAKAELQPREIVTNATHWYFIFIVLMLDGDSGPQHH